MKLCVTIWLLSIALLIEAQKIAQNQTPKNSRTEEINGGDERRRHLTISEVNGKTLSISFRIDEGVIKHNNRIFIAKNVDGKRVWDNIRAYSVSFSTISIIACIRITSVNSLVSVFLYDGGFVQFEGIGEFEVL